jgi:hypothetical protein
MSIRLTGQTVVTRISAFWEITWASHVYCDDIIISKLLRWIPFVTVAERAT